MCKTWIVIVLPFYRPKGGSHSHSFKWKCVILPIDLTTHLLSYHCELCAELYSWFDWSTVKLNPSRYMTPVIPHTYIQTHTHIIHCTRLQVFMTIDWMIGKYKGKKQLDGFSNHSQTGHLINWQHINLSICMIVVHKTMIWDNIMITMDRLVLLFDTVTSSICIHNPIYHYAILTRSFSGNNTCSFSLSLSFSISFSFPLCRSQQEILSMCNWTIIPIELRYNQHWTFP